MYDRGDYNSSFALRAVKLKMTEQTMTTHNPSFNPGATFEGDLGKILALGPQKIFLFVIFSQILLTRSTFKP